MICMLSNVKMKKMNKWWLKWLFLFFFDAAAACSDSSFYKKKYFTKEAATGDLHSHHTSNWEIFCGENPSIRSFNCWPSNYSWKKSKHWIWWPHRLHVYSIDSASIHSSALFFYSILSIYERACACKTKKTKSTTIFTTKSKRSLEEIKNSNNVNITNAPRTYKHAQTVFEINKFFFACRFLGWIRLQCVFPNYWLVYFIILLHFFFFCFILIHSFSVFPLINSN